MSSIDPEGNCTYRAYCWRYMKKITNGVEHFLAIIIPKEQKFNAVNARSDISYIMNVEEVISSKERKKESFIKTTVRNGYY